MKTKQDYFKYGHSCFFSIFRNSKGEMLKGWRADWAWAGYCFRDLPINKALACNGLLK